MYLRYLVSVVYYVKWLFTNRVYQWTDDKGKKSRLSAPQYIDYVMTYVQKTINDETVFPTKHGEHEAF